MKWATGEVGGRWKAPGRGLGELDPIPWEPDEVGGGSCSLGRAQATRLLGSLLQQ